MSADKEDYRSRHHRRRRHQGRRRRDPFDPLCKLRVADSVFLGYVLPAFLDDDECGIGERERAASSSSSSSPPERDGYDYIRDFRRRLIESRHRDAAHIPWCAIVPSPPSSPSPSPSPLGPSCSSSRYDDDGEPTVAGAGRAMLRELRRHVRGLERRPTSRIRGGGARGGRGGSWDDVGDVGDDVGNDVGDDDKCEGEDEDEDEDEDDDEDEEGEREGGKDERGEDGGNDDERGDESGGVDDRVEGQGWRAPAATAVIVVRYFGTRLLGATSGRLGGLYARTARLALHRHAEGRDVPFVERHRGALGCDWYVNDDAMTPTATTRRIERNLYGLGAGDSELILNAVIPPAISSSYGDDDAYVRDLLRELKFERMAGPNDEPLPRLQNLQADRLLVPPIVGGWTGRDEDAVVVPVYRYPGNYSGLEYPTHPWSPTSLVVRRAVEAALQPLYVQGMNHCVTNLYRDGRDDIGHHSDKDLDLYRDGVIVSVSFGSWRVMEVRDRTFPHDVARVDLPPGSMFVLGPYTNAGFTHAVLPLSSPNNRDGGGRHRGSHVVSEGGGDETGTTTTSETSDDVRCNVEEGGRISLTFRDVRTFLDVKTQRLFGQGVTTSTSTPTTASPPPFAAAAPSATDLNEDGGIRESSLSAALERVREQDKRERCGTAMVALVMGTTAGYVSSKFSNDGGERTPRESVLLALLHAVSTVGISGSASYWYIRRRRRETRLKSEEDEARAFFSKKSASGNKY